MINYIKYIKKYYIKYYRIIINYNSLLIYFKSLLKKKIVMIY